MPVQMDAEQCNCFAHVLTCLDVGHVRPTSCRAALAQHEPNSLAGLFCLPMHS